MVLTRSQRNAKITPKSKGHSEESGGYDSSVQENDLDVRNPSPADDEKPQPDSTTTPPVSDKDAVTTNDGCPQERPTKGRRSRKRSRKRKLTVERERQTGESLESCISSTSSPDRMPKESRSKSEKTSPDNGMQDIDISKLVPTATCGTKENAPTTSEIEEENKRDERLEVKALNVKEVLQLYKQESYADGQAVKPKGRPKSGRTWKTEQTNRFSGMKQDRPLKSSWQKKMQQKAEMKNLKAFEAELKETKSKELERKKQHRAKKIKRKLENERKSEIVQVISNPAKIKRMKKKQLRKIEMRSLPDSSKKQVFSS
ncbi:coiled-coil domain-containing protein 86-like [Acanthaster planci]|uniref:Coiled-coil domain-containing protein 86 n=1 Tax=Acanthaster planci TaxID=133434 RepID=A0A8B7ZFV9_ACAPL|nr:coiled-coil domain-containing protein 86-like [Acanthaster planci]